MEEAKQRNRDHLRNKQKYKSKSFKDPKHVPPKSTRHLVSNWDRYEKETDILEFQPTGNTDFSILASAPITKGHYFQFKSDKLLAEDIGNKIPAELFSLNLQLLRQSILTIPFYNRVGIDAENFTENQLKFMDRDAVINLTKYNEKYVNDMMAESTTQSCSKDKNQCTTDVLVSNKQDEKETCITSDLTEASDITELQRPQKKADDDLEQWLDNILDD